MSLSDLAAVGSFISGIAVVFSFVFLTLQIRQNARATASSAMGTWLGDYNNMLLRISNDAEFALLIRKGLTDFDGQTPNDQMRFHTFMSQINLNAIYLFNQRNAGAFDGQVAGQILGFTAPDFMADMDNLIETSSRVDVAMPWFGASDVQN